MKNNYKIETSKKALHDSLLIEVIKKKSEIKTPEGWVIPDEILEKNTDQSCVAYIVDIGPRVKEKAKENDIEVGDLVYFRKYAGIQLPERDDPFDPDTKRDYRAIYFDDVSAKEGNIEILRETHEVKL